VNLVLVVNTFCSYLNISQESGRDITNAVAAMQQALF